MNNTKKGAVNTLVIALVALVVLGGAGFFVLRGQGVNKPGEAMQNKTSDTVMAEDGIKKDEQSAMEKSEGSRYVEYSKKVLDEASEKRRVLYFYANWCPICRPADANFKANANQIPEDVVLIRVNYNDSDTDVDEEKLASQYSITYQHTFVQIDENGNALTKWNGGELKELLANIE